MRSGPVPAGTVRAPWKPRLSHRCAFLKGDHGDTPESEAFDPLFPGFLDWGTWWQGQIAGEYVLEGMPSGDVALELDAYADWKFSTNFSLSLVGAFADPKSAVRQGYDRTKNFYDGMAYVAYAF